MVMTYRGNEQQWKRLMEVDWLGQYGKAWITFNAWYRNSFDRQKRDRQIIEEIKTDDGDIRSKVENLLLGKSSDQKSFQSDVADLHRLLSAKPIKSDGERISFEAVEDYQHAKPIDEKKNKVSYKIKINVPNKQRIATIATSNGVEILCETIGRGTILDTQQLTGLSDAQRQTLNGFLKASTPIHNLLASDSNPLEIGSFKFINDPTLIARAIIEILYQLRNAFFHGEITPDSETQEVYQPAYLILQSIIPGA